MADWLGDADVLGLRVGAAAGEGARFRVLLGSGAGVWVAAGPGVVAAAVALDDSVLVGFAVGDAEGGWLLGLGVPDLLPAEPAGVDDALAVELGLAVADGVGAGVDVLGVAVPSCTGSHDRPLATAAELAALAGLATVARLNSAAAVSKTPPANRVAAAGRACAKRMNAPPVLLDAVPERLIASRSAAWTSSAMPTLPLSYPVGPC